MKFLPFFLVASLFLFAPVRSQRFLYFLDNAEMEIAQAGPGMPETLDSARIQTLVDQALARSPFNPANQNLGQLNTNVLNNQLVEENAQEAAREYAERLQNLNNEFSVSQFGGHGSFGPGAGAAIVAPINGFGKGPGASTAAIVTPINSGFGGFGKGGGSAIVAPIGGGKMGGAGIVSPIGGSGWSFPSGFGPAKLGPGASTVTIVSSGKGPGGLGGLGALGGFDSH